MSDGLIEILTPDNLSQIIELFGIGFALGVGGGAAAFVITLFVNLFYGIAQG